MPGSLSKSPSTFVRMTLSILGDENFTSLLCYLDDLKVFAPTEELALKHLEMVFSHQKNYKLKLAPKKCHLLQRSARFLGHVICGDGVDEGQDEGHRGSLGGVSPSWKIKSFLCQ